MSSARGAISAVVCKPTSSAGAIDRRQIIELKYDRRDA
jgi:hypothetical protein